MTITTLKKARIKRGIKQKELAEKARKSIRTYQEYEAGERLPDVHTAQRLAQELKTTVEELFPIMEIVSSK